MKTLGGLLAGYKMRGFEIFLKLNFENFETGTK